MWFGIFVVFLQAIRAVRFVTALAALWRPCILCVVVFLQARVECAVIPFYPSFFYGGGGWSGDYLYLCKHKVLSQGHVPWLGESRGSSFLLISLMFFLGWVASIRDACVGRDGGTTHRVVLCALRAFCLFEAI